jgi:hypothetical protein
MLLRYWTKSKNQKIQIIGYDLDELKEFDIMENDLKYYLPLNADEIIKNDMQLLYLGY